MVNNKKHILFILENGEATCDLRVWPEATAAKEFGYDVSIICQSHDKKRLLHEQIEGINIYRHYTPKRLNHTKFYFFLEFINALLWESYLSIRLFVKHPFHFIHSANPPDHVFLIASFFKLFGTKFIFDHHDLSPEMYLAKFDRRDVLFRLLLLMERLSIKIADIVIATNASYKAVALERGGKHHTDVFVVRNGPSLSRMSFPKPNPGKYKCGFDFLVVYVGHIDKQERIDVLLKAAQHIVYEMGNRNIKFLIVGNGPYRQKLLELCTQMRLNKNVSFTGYVPYHQFYEILATADLCVNPEFKNDFTDKSTMIKIMDYMTFGKPIVQFDVTEGRVTAGEASIYVRQNDFQDFSKAIVKLLKDVHKREKMGQIGRKRIWDSLNWDIQKTNLQQAYTYLEKNPGSGFLLFNKPPKHQTNIKSP
jgi:glycosyltransferase involved in cell wall biosynthesis